MKKIIKWLLPILVIAMLMGTLVFSASAADTAVNDKVALYRNGAVVNGNEQVTFATAVNNAQAGDTIKLLGNVSVSDGTQVTKSITIDIGSYALDFSGKTSKHAFYYTAGGEVNVKGTGKVVAPNSASVSLFATAAGATCRFNFIGEADDHLEVVLGGSSNAFDHRGGNLNFTNVDFNINSYATIALRQLYTSTCTFANSSININSTTGSYPLWLQPNNASDGGTRVLNIIDTDINVTNLNSAYLFFCGKNSTVNIENSKIDVSDDTKLIAGNNSNGYGILNIKDGVAVTLTAWNGKVASITVTMPASDYVNAYIDAGKTIEFVSPENAINVTYIHNGQELGSRLTKVGSAPAWDIQLDGYIYENNVLYTKGAFCYDEELNVTAPIITKDTSYIYVSEGKGSPCVWAAFSGEPSLETLITASTDSNEIISAVTNSSVAYIQGYADLTMTHTGSSPCSINRNLTIDVNNHGFALTGAHTNNGFNPGTGVTFTLKNATVTSEVARLLYPLDTNPNIVLENLVLNWTAQVLADYRGGGTFTAKNCVFNFNGYTGGNQHSFNLFNSVGANKTLNMSFVDCTVNMASSAKFENAFVSLSSNVNTESTTVNVAVKGCEFNLNSKGKVVFTNASSAGTFNLNVDANELESEKGSSSFASAVPYFKVAANNSKSTFTLANGVAFESPINETNVINNTPVYPAEAVFARQNNAKYPYVLTDNYVTVNVVLNGNTTPTAFVNGYTGEPGSDADNSYMLVTVENALRVAMCETAWYDENDAPIEEFVAADGMTVIGKSEPTDVYAAWEILNADQNQIVLCSFDQGYADDAIDQSALAKMTGGAILRLHADLSCSVSGGSTSLPNGAVIDLNGNKLTMTNFRFNMISEKNRGYTIKNGTLDCISYGNNILFSNLGNNGYTNFEDVTFLLKSGIPAFDIRGGNLNLTNCTYNGNAYFLYTASRTREDCPISINVNGGTYTTTSDFIRLEGASTVSSKDPTLVPPYFVDVDIQVSGDTVIDCGLLINLYGNYTNDSTVDISFTGAKISSVADKLINSNVDTNFNLYFGQGCKFSHDPADIKGSYAPDSITTAGGLAIMAKEDGKYHYAIDIPVRVDWNLTLHTDFDINFIVKYDNVYFIKVNGVKKPVSAARQPDGTYVISVKSIAANLIAENMTIEIGYDDEYIAVFNTCVVDYANAILNGNYSDLTKNLVAGAMNYVFSAYEYAKTIDPEAKATPDALKDLVESDIFADYLPANTEIGNSENIGNANLAIASAQLNLDAKLKFRFNLNESYSGTLTVGGKTYDVTNGKVGDKELTYVELNMNTFALCAGVITISGEASDGTAINGEYSLATYVNGVSDTADTTAQALLTALATYTYYASDYKAEYDNFSNFEFEKHNGSYVIVGYTGDGKNVIIPGTYQGLYVTEIAAYVFAGNTTIESIEILDGVKTIGIGAFKGCTALKSVEIPNTVIAIGARAFEDTGLTEVVIPDSVEAIGHGAFMGCNDLVSITLPFVGANLSDSNNYFGYIFGAFSYVGNVDYVPESLTTVILSDACTDVPAYAFVGCKSITSITIGSGVKRIGTSAFQSCTGLKTIYIPATVTEILAKGFYYNSPFIGCSSELTIYTEADDISAFGTYWRNLTANDQAEVVTGTTYDDYLQAIAD